MGYIKNNEVKIYYETHGNGKPLLFIEGLAQQIFMWKYQIEGLKNFFKIVTFDIRGSGMSDKPQNDYSMEAFVEDTKKIIEELKLDKPDILSLSLGGFIAQAFAVKYGSLINKLILANTAFGGPKYVPPSQEILNLMIYGGKGDTPLEKAVDTLSYSFTQNFVNNHNDRICKIAEELLQNPQPSYAYQGQAMLGATFNMENEVKSIKNSTLIIVSEEDRVVPMENGLNLHNAIPNSRLSTIKKAGHLSFIEKYEEFNTTVKNFLLDN
jgi:pimeloyl-ACP methyl ester carboxylesterase